MNAKKCDRCGKFYEHYNGDDIIMSHNFFKAVYGKRTYDLCPECMEKLREWFKEGDKTNE